ncbi:MAG: hypothetical protein U0183_23180 [Polyangiaceae bacterium]
MRFPSLRGPARRWGPVEAPTLRRAGVGLRIGFAAFPPSMAPVVFSVYERDFVAST